MLCARQPGSRGGFLLQVLGEAPLSPLLGQMIKIEGEPQDRL